MRAFADLTDDERAEWRSSPVTQAFIAWMKEEAESSVKGAIEAIRSITPEGNTRATLYVGNASALHKAVDTATRSFEE